MGLNIKNQEVEYLARQVADATGETKTEAIRKALMERRDRLGLRPLDSDLKQMEQTLREIHAGRQFPKVSKEEWDSLNS